MEIVIIVISTSILLLVALSYTCVWYGYRDARIASEIDLKLPKSWKELSNSQLKYVSLLMLGDNDAEDIQTKCFLYFTNTQVLKQYDASKWLCRHHKTTFVMHPWEIAYFTKKRLGYLTEVITEIVPLPKLAGLKCIHAQFKGVKFKQWMAAENYYQAYLYTRNEIYLNRLCAVMYPQNLNFEDENIEKQCKRFSRKLLSEKFTVFIWYSGLKSVLSKEFGYFFKRVNSSVNNASGPPNMRKQFNGMLRALNNGDITKTAEILDIETWLAFDMLNTKAQENYEMQQRLNKIRK